MVYGYRQERCSAHRAASADLLQQTKRIATALLSDKKACDRFVAPCLYREDRGTTPTEAQRRQLLTAGELQTRLTLSFALITHTTIDRSTPAGLRAYVLDFILPLITDWNRPQKS